MRLSLNGLLPRRRRTISAARAAELAAHYQAEPRLFGLYLSACNLRVNRLAALRCAIAMTRRNVFSGPAIPFDAGLRISAQVLVDAPTGPKHAALLLPIAAELTEKGVSVAMACHGRRSREVIRSRFGGRNSSPFELVGLPDTAPRQFRRRLPSVTAYRRSLPWQGFFGHAMALLERDSDGLVSMWKAALQRSNVRVVLSTYVLSNWSNALFYAARQLGLHCVYVQQGIPGGSWFASTNCTVAMVWSLLGRAALKAAGFNDRPVIITRNPSIPRLEIVETLRTKRRKALGLAAGDLCVLVLGVMPVDQAFAVDGYHEACELQGKGLSIAARSGGIVPFLRPHYRDLAGETERAFRQHELPILLVSKGAPLHEDIAAADVVLSDGSTAMEEAYLMGRPIVHTVAEGIELGFDFGVLGAPVVRSSVELARYLTSRNWIAGLRQPPDCRSAAAEICEMLDS